MFTGLIQKIGKIAGIKRIGKSARLTIMPDTPFENLVRGESIAVNGVCLTLEKTDKSGRLEFFTLEETLLKTNLGRLKPESKVNLERALRANDRFGGHIVSGHVDSVSKIIDIQRKNADIILKTEINPLIGKYIVSKGNVALDGISLTVVEVKTKYFSVHIIPETWASTALPYRKKGDLINVETDILAKYVERLLGLPSPSEVKKTKNASTKSKITIAKLIEAGW